MKARQAHRTNQKRERPIMKRLSEYRLSRWLLRLQHEDELLLVNTLNIRPLLVREGRDIVEAALKAVGTKTTTPPGDKQLYQALHDYGIIVEKRNPEKAPYIDYHYNADSEKSGMTLYLLMSQRCNLRCRYCFADEFPYRQEEDMPMKVAKRAIEKDISRLRRGGSLSIIFFGGEPLMNWPAVKDTIRFVEEEIKPVNRDKTIKYHITTNLSALPDDFVAWVKAYGITLLTDVDGDEAAVHDHLRPGADGGGSFDRIVKNIEFLKRQGIRPEVRATICRSNQDRIFDIAQRGAKLSGGGCVLELVTPFDCSQNPIPEELLPDIDRYIEDILSIYRSGKPPVENIFPINKNFEKLRSGRGESVGCGMPWGNIHIVDHAGDVYMCTFLVGQEEYRLGNVFDPGVTYEHEQEAVDRAFKRVHVDHVEQCSKCNWRYLCTGHCPIARLAIEARDRQGKETPSYVRQYSFAKSCKMTRTFYKTLLWDLARDQLPEPQVGVKKTNECGTPVAEAVA